MDDCATCRWFEPMPADRPIEVQIDVDRGPVIQDRGRCRSLPPRPGPVGVAAEWPIVMASDWCGGFEALDPRPARRRKSQGGA